jgi:uncharacterized protein YlxW (UPF0749 family)
MKPETEGEVKLESFWNRKVIALVCGALFVLGSLVGGNLSRLIFQTPSEQVHQDDRIDNLDQRVTKLEAIAQTNSEMRIRLQERLEAMQVRLDLIGKQHEEMLRELSAIRDALGAQSRELRRQAER